MLWPAETEGCIRKAWGEGVPELAALPTASIVGFFCVKGYHKWDPAGIDSGHDWASGPGWVNVIDAVVRLATPIPAKGRLWLWPVAAVAGGSGGDGGGGGDGSGDARSHASCSRLIQI